MLQQSYNTIPCETAKIGFAPRSVLKVLRQSSGTFVNLHAETPSEKHDECLPDAKTLPSYSRKQTHAAFGCILQPLLFVRGTPNAGAEAARVPGERSSVLGFFGVFRVRDCGCLLILMCSFGGVAAAAFALQDVPAVVFACAVMLQASLAVPRSLFNFISSTLSSVPRKKRLRGLGGVPLRLTINGASRLLTVLPAVE